MTQPSSNVVDGRQDGDPARILIVEDEALNALYLASALEVSGYDVTGVAATASEAIQLATETPPDLVLPDLVLMDITLRGWISPCAARSTESPPPAR